MIDFVYADCAASAPVLPCALPSQSLSGFRNPNSVHRDGRIARGFLEKAREDIAECINASPGEIAFTPSATAACHYAVRRLDIKECSNHEHKAVYDAVQKNVERPASCSPGSFAYMLADNETGARYDFILKETAREYSVFSDATAAVGQIPVDVKDLGVAALAAGGHKFGALPGIGFVYVRGGVKDDDTFPGTPPVALAVGMADALKYRTGHMAESTQYLMEQTACLAMSLRNIPGAHINTPFKGRLPNILSVRFDGVNARELLSMLDVNGVRASAGSACTADADAPSRTLLASGLTPSEALSTIRLSFCPETKPDEFIFVLNALERAVSALRRLTV